jgi:hypothetical protein
MNTTNSGVSSLIRISYLIVKTLSTFFAMNRLRELWGLQVCYLSEMRTSLSHYVDCRRIQLVHGATATDLVKARSLAG